MIAKKWHVNEAPLQGSFLLLSPLKTIRWCEGGHGGSHLAQRRCGAHSSALPSPEAAAAQVRARTRTPPPSSAACETHGPDPAAQGAAGPSSGAQFRVQLVLTRTLRGGRAP